MMYYPAWFNEFQPRQVPHEQKHIFEKYSTKNIFLVLFNISQNFLEKYFMNKFSL